MAKGENIYKRKDGRWEGRYPKARKIDGSIHYGYIYAHSYRGVKDQLIEKKAQIKAFIHSTSHEFSGTFNDWVQSWLDEQMISQLKQSTYASYSSKLQLYVLPYLGNKPLKKITLKDMNQFIQHLVGKLSPSSIQTVFRIVKSCFESAKERGFLFINPCERVELPKLDKKKIKALSIEEQKAVEHESKQTEKGLPILLALETGMRIGEICALKWEDIDFNTAQLNVRHTIQRVSIPDGQGHRTQIIETEPKTASAERTIPLSKRIKNLLLKEQSQTCSKYVFANGSQPVEPRTISYRFEKIKQKLGLKQLSFHSLRHTFATRCVELGVNISTISSLLGHASIKMTLDTYVSSFMDEKREAVEKLAFI